MTVFGLFDFRKMQAEQHSRRGLKGNAQGAVGEA
jgi:hypothetical protein